MTPRALAFALLVFLVPPAADAGSAVPRRPAVTLDRIIATEGDVLTRLGSRLVRTVRGENPGLFERPYGVAWQGNALLVTDPRRAQLMRVDLDRQRIERSPVPFGEPLALVPCFDGIAVSDSASGTVSLLGADLERVRDLATGLDRPTGLACLGDSLAVAETRAHRIAIVASDGTIRRFGARGSAPGEYNYPTMLAAHGGRIYVCDSMNFRVQIVDLSGAPIASFGQIGDRAGSMPRLKGIAVDATGNVWVSDGSLDELAVFDSNGTFLLRVGGPGDGAGAFAFPAGLALRADGMLAVADSLNGRVQVLRVSPGSSR